MLKDNEAVQGLKVLVVEDDEQIRNLLHLYLENEGAIVAEAITGNEALDKFAADRYDFVILDVMLPELDGWKVCREIRQESKVPIIFVSAKGGEAERILGLELGADDYLIKPFSVKELMARIKVVLRRLHRESLEIDSAVLNFGPLVIDHESRKVLVNGNEVNLTLKEYDLLHFLASNRGKVFGREKILERVWGFLYYDTRTIDTHIKQLREKLTRMAGAPEYLTTVRGVGYKFEVR